MARIAPSQPNEAMWRIAPRSPLIPLANIKFGLDSIFFSASQTDSKI
jgi:hypothetical protein